MSEQQPQSNPQIIDGLPSAEELARLHSPYVPTYERIDSALFIGFDPSDPSSNQDTLGQTILKNFSNKLQWSSLEQKDDLVRDAYGIARHLGDSIIHEADNDAFSLLDGSRSYASFGSVFVAESNDAGHVRLVSRGEDHGDELQMGVDVIGQVFKDGKTRQAIEQKIVRSGAEVRPQDVSLLTMLLISAHESGHMIQSGLNKLLPAATDETYRRVADVDMTAKQIVAARPEHGQTGNLETDSRIYNERFAEGYGLIVVKRAAELLGYDELTVNRIVAASMHTADAFESPEYLHEVTADKSLGEVLKEKGSTAYAGEQGYLQPLSVTEIVVGLNVVSNVLRSDQKSLPDAVAYAEQFGLVREHREQDIASTDLEAKHSKGVRLGKLFKDKLRKVA